MPPAVTVIPHVEPAGQDLVRLVESIDAQSLPYAEFDVIFLVSDQAGAVRERLGQLAQRRPNVEVRSFGGARSEAVLDAARSARGEWVLPIGPSLQGPKAVLLPEALQRLVEFGRTHDCDAVVGRVSALAPDVPIPHVLSQDAPRVSAGRLSDALRSPARMYRTDLVRSHGLLPSVEDALRLTEISAQVGVLSAYCTFRNVTIGVGPSGSGEVEVSFEGASWRNGALALQVELGGAENASLILSVRHRQTGEEYWLGTDQGAEPGVYSARLDVGSAAVGAALREGPWEIYVNAYDGEGAPLARTALPRIELPAAVVDGIFVAPAAADGHLTLDVGGTATSPLPSLSVDQVSVTEDADGTLLTAQLSPMHVAGASEHEAALRLDAFRLPGKFVSDGHTARLECFVSGLAGTSVLSYQIGFGPMKRTSLNLVIDDVGGISVVPTPPPSTGGRTPAAGPAARKPAATKRADKGPANRKTSAKRRAATRATGKKPVASPGVDRALMTRIRRNVPGLLEPAVKKVAKNGRARAVYRKLAGFR